MDALANVDAKLVCLDDTRKRLSRSLATDGFPEKVFVLSEQHPPERRGPIQQFRILKFRGTVSLSRQHVNASDLQRHADRPAHVHVGVELETQGMSPIARSLRRPGESADSAASFSTRSRLSAIALSNSCLWS